MKSLIGMFFIALGVMFGVKFVAEHLVTLRSPELLNNSLRSTCVSHATQTENCHQILRKSVE